MRVTPSSTTSAQPEKLPEDTAKTASAASYCLQKRPMPQKPLDPSRFSRRPSDDLFRRLQ